MNQNLDLFVRMNPQNAELKNILQMPLGDLKKYR